MGWEQKLYSIIIIISIDAQVFIEMCTLWLVTDYIVSHHNPQARGDYSRSTKFQNGCLLSMFLKEKIQIWKVPKDAKRLAEHFLKERYEVLVIE